MTPGKMKFISVLLIMSTMLVGVPYLMAQQQTAQLTGDITDTTGAAVSGASVIVENKNHGIRVKAQSNSRGIYTVPLLPPASGYEIIVSYKGFRTSKRTGITLQVDQTAKVDFSLAVGTSTQTVTVTGAPPLLDTQTSSIGQVITARTITHLPLNGRSSFRLIRLTPGVIFNQSAYGQFGDVPVNTTFDTNFSINGGQSQSNEILIDGVPSTAGFFDQITTIPIPEDTQEFKVESNNLSAEYGRYTGGVVNVSTKSGTNQLHGTAFEFLRNSALDANSYFQKQAGKSVPPLRMNQFGGVLGGPVVIPHLYNGHNRTFFFVSYQGTRRVEGATFFGTVPTAAQRKGDFSQTYNAKGQLVNIYNPFSTKTNPNNQSQYIRTAFPNNAIPSNMIDPVAKKIMSYYPMPNTQGDPNTNANNYISNAARSVAQDEGSARIDQNVNSHYHLFGRLAWFRTNLTQPNTFGNVATGGPGAVGTTKFDNWSIVYDNTVTVNPTLFFTVDYGFARWFQSRKTLSYGFDNSTLGFPSQFVKDITIPMFPSINMQGYSNMNGQSYFINGNNSHSVLASVTKLLGRQTLVAGTDIRVHLIHYYEVARSAGTFNFHRAQTQGPDPNKASSTSGNGFASFLLGVGSGGSIPIGVKSNLKNWYAAAYLEDDWRVTHKLTVNLGLRYSEQTPYVDANNKLNYFSPTVSSPAANPSFPNLTGGLVFAGVHGNSSNVYTWRKNQWGPRFGFAYSALHNTVVRGGFGIVYAPLELSNNAVGFAPTTGFSSSTGWESTTNGGLIPYNLLSNPYPQGLVQPTGASLGAGTALGQSLAVWDAHPKTPRSYQWNFGIQQQLPSHIVIEAAYVASRGLHLTHNFELNTLNPKYLSMGTALQKEVTNPFAPYIHVGTLSRPTVNQQQLLLPYPQFTGISVENSTWGWSNYQSAQFKINKRTSHGISFLAAYTISKWMSNITPADAPIGPTNNTGVQNWYDLAAEKSLSPNDIPQSLIVNTVVQLPFGRGHRLLSHGDGFVERLASGWTASAIMKAQMGFPLALSAPITDGGNRPNYVPGVNPKLSSSRSTSAKLAEWFNTSAFAIPPAFTFGNVSRTIGSVRSPGVRNTDFSLQKRTRIVGPLHMLFRADAFNLTNTPHFGFPNTNAGSPSFGKIHSVIRSPPAREIQFAVKLSF